MAFRKTQGVQAARIARDAALRGAASRRAIVPGRVALVLALSVAVPAVADDLPLWEVGIGPAVLTYPEYRGSARQQTRPLPLPYLVYRGDALRLDRRGLRGLLLDTPRLSVDLSMDGALPAGSNDGGLRQGMPDLDPVVEIGPSINWMLRQGERSSLHLRVPVRAVIATDLRAARQAGWKVHPSLSFRLTDVAGGWALGTGIGPVFASRAYHDYYYSVDPRFATNRRPAYQAGGGYSGMAAQFSFSRRFDNFWAGGFIRYDHLGGASFRHSPLVERSHSVSAGVGVAWVFGQSSRQVPAERDAGGGL